MFFGLLEPYASLYERAFSRYGARIEHARLEETLRHEFGVNVILLKQAILAASDREKSVRDRLVSAARESIMFCGDAPDARLALQDFERGLDSYDAGHFFNILLLNPGIFRESGTGTREIQLNITERQPLSNLYFMRDQQAVTDRGIVLGRMAKPQRARETVIMRLLWETLGIPVLDDTSSPGTLEGGDFIPMKDFALVGTGDRTNREGAERLLARGLGFDEVAFVRQPTHPLLPGGRPDPMITMHLDTYFNVASSGVVVGSELLMGRAAVEVWHREGDGYRKENGETNLYEYIRSKGFDMINLTTLEQMAYAPNFLCIRDGTILTVEVDRTVKEVLGTLSARAGLEPSRYGRLLSHAEKEYRMLRAEGQFFPHKKEVYCSDIDAYPLILRNLTGGYGAAHCMTCALSRG
jgi:arginine deiminase